MSSPTSDHQSTLDQLLTASTLSKKTVFLTGVSSGLGRGTALALCQRGYDVVGTVRNAKDAEQIKALCGPKLTPLLLDVRDAIAVAALPTTLRELGVGPELAGLINNAGIACSGPAISQSIEDIRNQFEVNVFGLIGVTKALLPMLGADPSSAASRTSPPGRIVNISSIGGRVATPFIAGYCASKFAVEGFSHALRRELMPFGVDVVIVGPGSVRSAIWSKVDANQTSKAADAVYGEPLRRFTAMSQRIESTGYTEEEAGRRVAAIFEHSRHRARYAMVKGRLVNWTLPSLMPDRWLDAVVGWALALRRVAGGR